MELKQGSTLASPTRTETSLLEIDTMEARAWMEKFVAMDCPLSQSLVLVALLHEHGLIQVKETGQFKRYLLDQHEGSQKMSILVNSFLKDKSLFKLRSTIRGLMGLPRMRANDPRQRSGSCSTARSHRKSVVEDLQSKILLGK